MNLLDLDKCLAELKTASQSLWDARQKNGATVEEANLMEGAQLALHDLQDHLQECRAAILKTAAL